MTPSMVVGRFWRSVTAWDAAVFPSAGEKARTDPAEPSTPTRVVSRAKSKALVVV